VEKSEKISLFDSISLFLRRLLVFSIIVAVAALALFWETLPSPVKKTVRSLSANPSDEDELRMVPNKFRMDIQPNSIATQINRDGLFECRNTPTNDEVIINTSIAGLHDELKQLGAISCRLTWWGDSKNMFRFLCQVPVSEHNPNAIRTFQSIAPDAIQSMQEVIDQVRKWKEENVER
jgi:hypothetical protein